MSSSRLASVVLQVFGGRSGHIRTVARTLCNQHYCTVDNVGSSDFWRRKMVTFFRLHDADGDGRIDWTDYVRVQTRLCQNAQMNMRQEIEVMRNFRKLWEFWLGPVIDPHHTVTQEEFIKALQKAVNDPAFKTADPKQTLVWSFFYTIFELMDLDNNSLITPDEYRAFFQAYGLSREEADRSFTTVDVNNDGTVTIEEFVNVAFDFLYSGTENSIGNHFFGDLIEDTAKLPAE